MKTLINKTNPQIRITAPEIEALYDKCHRVEYYHIKDLRLGLLQDNWTLVEEEPEKLHIDKPRGYNLVSEDATANGFNQPKEPEKDGVRKLREDLTSYCIAQIKNPTTAVTESEFNVEQARRDAYADIDEHFGILAENLPEEIEEEPVDLEKAADDYVMQTASGTAEEMETLIDAFKAGVKWMAEQGITYKDKVMPTTDNSGNIDGYCLDGENEFAAVKAAVENGYLKVGDKVIVQIRKAE